MSKARRTFGFAAETYLVITEDNSCTAYVAFLIFLFEVS